LHKIAHILTKGETLMTTIRSSHRWFVTGVATMMLAPVALSGAAQAQTTSAAASLAAVQDPGVRGGAAGAGGPLPGLGPDELKFFFAAKEVFKEVDTFAGGLGPRFNLDGCAGCHAQPDVGGTSPATNPQVAVATANQAINVVPPFVTLNGPVREARFVKNPDGTPDGGVHDLFVITGRTDAPTTCHITQPNFNAALAANNVIFRIPTPTFGLGLVENVADRDLVEAANDSADLKAALGVSGRFNRNGNDGTITRFGWKAQNKSLLIFAGEAYNVEQGVTNEAFPNEREDDPGCATNPTPEDPTKITPTGTPTGSNASDFSADIVNFAGFMRFLAPPTAVTPATSSAAGVVNVSLTNSTPTTSPARGRLVFANVGCQTCHVSSLTTQKSPFTGQNNVTFSPLSDFALHDMGRGLADRVSQGLATGSEFRTAPLWGIGQRIFFLHDGRTTDLLQAIEQHSSPGSEANGVITIFNILSPNDKQALLNYLRSL
jgi:CxxC motif-containing protein (DUF1111 family)